MDITQILQVGYGYYPNPTHTKKNLNFFLSELSASPQTQTQSDQTHSKKKKNINQPRSTVMRENMIRERERNHFTESNW